MNCKTLSNIGKLTQKTCRSNLSFDAALCRWGLMFLPNLNSTLIKVHRPSSVWWEICCGSLGR